VENVLRGGKIDCPIVKGKAEKVKSSNSIEPVVYDIEKGIELY